MQAETVLPSDFFERLSRPPACEDPHAELARLRVEPVPRLRSGELVFARHADVVAVLRDPAFVKPSMPSIPIPAIRATMRNFLLLNDPDHARLRRAVAPLFTSSAVERRRARVVERTGWLLDGRTRLDVIGDLAYPLPLGMISDALGVPPEDEHQVAVWGSSLLETLDNPMPLTARGMLRMAAAVIQRRSHPVALLRSIAGIAGYARRCLLADDAPEHADVLRTLRAAVRDDVMSLDEAIGTWVLIVIAGHETTANIIGTTMHLLLAHPDQRALVDGDSSLVSSAVLEALRLESPVPLGIREAAADSTVGDLPIARGTMVYVLFGAANRDPDVFVAPDRFDIRRTERGHVAFGYGSHFCVGAQLAQLEAEVAISELLRRAPALAPNAKPRWRATFATRGIAELPVTLDAG